MTYLEDRGRPGPERGAGFVIRSTPWSCILGSLAAGFLLLELARLAGA